MTPAHHHDGNEARRQPCHFEQSRHDGFDSGAMVALRPAADNQGKAEGLYEIFLFT
jgi:hypothetical protein